MGTTVATRSRGTGTASPIEAICDVFPVSACPIADRRLGWRKTAGRSAPNACRAAVAYAVERQTFGALLIDHQALAFALADMACRLSSARMMTYAAASAYDAGAEASVLAAQAKLVATEASHDIVDGALQIMGGAGYVKPNPVERMYRDQRVTEIYEGTSEIQRLLIARAIRAQALGTKR